MIFTKTKLDGVFLIDPELNEDERGFFTRIFCTQEFEAHHLNPIIIQCSLSSNIKKGTLRGLHYQDFPYPETKIVSCIRGAIYDVILDLRPESKTYHQWLSIELNAVNHRMVYIPQYCAHGFQTLIEDTEVMYFMSESFHPECAKKIHWNDPSLQISWPLPITSISKKDLS